ncbi:helix-turn-helix domain-containing protein [Streptomyces sp. NPDC102405]|uniref:helix-turn-helix domain-containing protein n=1 Tax=Streptomyces sp. NPDC102405 TaxID=3366170 RepID=UPI00380EBDFE
MSKPMPHEVTPTAVWIAALELLARQAGTGSSSEDLHQRLVAVGRQLTGFDFCAVLLPDETGTQLLIRAWAGLDTFYVEQINSRNPLTLGSTARQSPSSRAYTSGVSVWVSDITRHADFTQWSGPARAQGYRTLLAVPLRAGDQIVGTFNCYNREVIAPDPQLRHLVEALTDFASAALEITRLRQAETGRVNQLEDLNEELRDRQARDERSQELHRRLTDVALTDSDLAHLAHESAQMLGARFLKIVDASGFVLAQAGPDSAEDLAPESPNSAVVLLHGETAARIEAFGATLEPDMAARALEHAATVCALLLLRDRTAAEAEARFRDDLIGDLFSGDPERRTAARQRALRANLLVDEVQVVVMKDHSDVGAAKFDNSPLGRRMRSISSRRPRLVCGRLGDYWVALWPISEGARDIAATLTQGAIAPQVHAVVAPASGSQDLARAFRMARGALELGGSQAPLVRTIEDLGVVGLLLQLEDHRAVANFSDRVLGALRQSDFERSTDLILTLRTYLAHDCRADVSAQKLFVHKNTISQRLRRIEKLTGLSLASPSDVLQFSAALAADDIRSASASPGSDRMSE